jgi:hypothetical protein
LVGDRSINLIILQDNMVVLANDLPWHMLVSVCLLSSNSNVHTKPEKNQAIMKYNKHWLGGPLSLLIHRVEMFLPGVKQQEVKLTTHLNPVLRLRMSTAIPLIPLYAFRAWTRRMYLLNLSCNALMSWKRDWYDECARIMQEINEACQKYLEFPTRAKQKEYQQKKKQTGWMPRCKKRGLNNKEK